MVIAATGEKDEERGTMIDQCSREHVETIFFIKKTAKIGSSRTRPEIVVFSGCR